jgi:hypothetical protein
MTHTTIEFGNKDITITLTGGTAWEGGGNYRVYYDVSQDSKKMPITHFFEILNGSTSDDTVQAGGRTFGYQRGFCDSKTKRKAATEAAQDLANQVAA